MGWIGWLYNQRMNMKTIIEIISYNDKLFLALFILCCGLGASILFDLFIIKPIQWYWRWLWKGMNDEKRYELITITFKSARW